MPHSNDRNLKKRHKDTRKETQNTIYTLADDFTPPHTTDIAIIGAGASGMTAALMASAPDVRVCVFEQARACGTSILKTGNGSCNFSNTKLESSWYNHPEFVDEVFGTHASDDILRFFTSLGLVWTQKDSRLYPYSLKASSVRDVLVRALSQTQTRVCCNTQVERVEYVDTKQDPTSCLPCDLSRWHITSNAQGVSYDTYARAIIISTGGAHTLSYVTDLSPYLQVLPFEGVLCPLACAPSPLFVLGGTRFRVRLSLVREKHQIWSESGEILIRAWGVSGIVVFNASRIAHAGDTLVIDFLPELTHSDVHALFASRLSAICSKHTASTTSLKSSCANVLLGIFDEKCARVLGKLAVAQYGHTPTQNALAKSLSDVCKDFKLEVEHTTQTNLAQVHRGGISIEDIDPQTLAHTQLQGLFVCGEAMDIDGACGGYNLSWAWLSGIRAGKSACAYLKTSSIL